MEGYAFEQCTACSEKVNVLFTIADGTKVVQAYRDGGFEFLAQVFNEQGFLEKVTGLDKLYEEAEAALDNVDWEESSELSE